MLPCKSVVDRTLNERREVGTAGLLVLVDLTVWATDPVTDSGRLSWSITFLVPVLGMLATVAVALRRRRVVTAFVLLSAAAIVLTISSWAIGTSLPPSFAALFALGLLTTTVLRHSPGSTAMLLTSLAALAVVAESLRPMVISALYVLVVCEAVFGTAVGVGIYLRWSDWRRVAVAEAARADERVWIAREMHDMVGHYVSGIVVRAQAARHVAERQPVAAVAALESIEQAGTDAMSAMRRMVGGLRDDAPTTPSVTWDDVDQLIADAVAHGEPVQVSIEPGLRNTTTTLVPSVHRIVAESLTNIRRHAKDVTSIDVALVGRDGQLVVSVHDDGQPTLPCGHDSFGIVGMRERAGSLGGSLHAGPAPRGGWLVHAELPMGPGQ